MADSSPTPHPPRYYATFAVARTSSPRRHRKCFSIRAPSPAVVEDWYNAARTLTNAIERTPGGNWYTYDHASFPIESSTVDHPELQRFRDLVLFFPQEDRPAISPDNDHRRSLADIWGPKHTILGIYPEDWRLLARVAREKGPGFAKKKALGCVTRVGEVGIRVGNGVLDGVQSFPRIGLGFF